MESSLIERAKRFLSAQRKKKMWYRAMYGMAAIVVFVTTYMLILPAITMERETICGKEEHTHTEECYTTEIVEIEQDPVLICTAKTLEIHKHTDSCYTKNENGEKVLTCGQADFVLHTHDKNCYNEAGDLVCTLDEVKEHIHDNNCYETKKVLVCEKQESAGHSHTKDCYTKEKGSLICDAEEHTHGGTCYDENGNLICGKEEHTHSDKCYKWEDKLVCSKEESEGHSHDDSCYETVKTLKCSKKEAYVHKHTDNCYKNGVLTCGKLETAEHQHSEACFETPEPETEEKTVLVCEKDEHVHEDECFAEETEAAGVEETGTAGETDAVTEKDEDITDQVDENVESGKVESSENSGDLPESKETISEESSESGTAETRESDGDSAESKETIDETTINSEETDAAEVSELEDTVQNKDSSCTVYKTEDQEEETESSTANISAFSLRTVSAAAVAAVSESEAVDFGPYITDISISKLVNGSWTESTEFTDGDLVNVSISYSVPAEKVTSDNKVIYYQLPDGVRPLKEETGIVYNKGVAVGTYVIGTDGMITITFYDEFADGREFTGSIQFKGTVVLDDADEEGKIEFAGDGGSITVKPEEAEYDISVKKSGAVSDDDKTIKYTIIASSNSGTAGNTVTITDKFGTTDGVTPSYQTNSFKVYKIDADGNKTEVDISEDSITISDTDGFTITGLPALEAGESYEVTYTADVSVTTADGAASLSNSASAETGDIIRWTYNNVEISKTVLEKSGSYDPNTGYINWTITVNKDKLDISGYTLSDILPEGIEISGDVVIKDSDGNKVATIDSVKFVQSGYKFGDGSTDTYTVTFKTTAPASNGTVKNSANLEKDGDKSYSDSVDVGVTHRTEYSVLKYFNKESTDENFVTRYTWYSAVTLPEGKLSTFTYTDEISQAVDADGESQNNSHYAVASELQTALENSIKLYLSDGTTTTYSDGLFKITYYDAAGNKVEATDTSTRVVKFEVTVTPGEETIEAYKMELSYSTIADYSGMNVGETWKFKNVGKVGDVTYTGSTDYTKPKPLEKSAGVYHSDSNYTAWYDDGTTVDYDATNGILYYRILIRTEPGNQGDITITDILPEGAAYVEGSLAATFYYNPSYSYPTIEWWDSGGQQSYSLQDSDNVSSTIENGVLTVKISDGYNSNSAGQTNGNIIQLTYQVSVEKDTVWNDLSIESQNYTNKVTWGTNSDEVTTKVEREVETVVKTAEQVIGTDGKTTNQVEYKVVINLAGEDLDPNSDTLTLVDTLTTNDSINGAYLDLGSLTLYQYDPTKSDNLGTEMDSNRYVVQYDESTHKMTVTLPDELACILVYRYTVDRGSVNQPTLNNSVSLNGEFSNQISFKLDAVDSSATVEKSEVTIYKVDGDDYTKRLEGAVFEFSFFDRTKGENGEWVVVGTATTDENGRFLFHDQSEVEEFWVGKNFLYQLKEVTAPNGYSKTDKVYYFALMPSNTILDEFYESIGGSATGVNKEDILIFGVAGGALYIPNEFTGIRVHKEWNDSNGATIAAPTTEIKVQLIQHTMKPIGHTVTIITEYYNNIWDIEKGESATTTKTTELLVPDGSTISAVTGNYYVTDIRSFKITVNDEYLDDILLKNGQVTFSVGPITTDTTIYIFDGWHSYNGISYDYTYDMPEDYENLSSEAYGDVISLNSSNNWSAIWEGLPSEDSETGNSYYYTVKEITQIDGYTTTYVNNNGIQEGEIAIVNTKDVETPEYSLPETGGSGTLQYILGGFLLMLVSILMYIKKQNQKRGKRI